MKQTNDGAPNRRESPLEMSSSEFREAGHDLIERIARFLDSLPERPVSPAKKPHEIRALLGEGPLPPRGSAAQTILAETADLLFQHSLFNGHPRFLAYITSSAAPIGALADLLAASVNPNLGSFTLSPMGTEIEKQTIRWMAEMIGYPADCGGILVSGGNMANFVGFLVARKAKTPWDIRTKGIPQGGTLRVYASEETHTWIQKAADLFGIGTDAIRWIPTDHALRMNTIALENQIRNDRRNGNVPILVIGTAGSVSTGAVDPLPEIAAICRRYGLWFHVDGAYGGFAAMVPGVPEDLGGISYADSVAIDPHKWLYAPLEAGCTLVRNPQDLRGTFSYRPPYYHFGGSGDEEPTNFYEYGPQNSRGFRALKVWMGLRQAGREGYDRMITDDIRLARLLYERVKTKEVLQPFSHGLSITTFRYAPRHRRTGKPEDEAYLNELNTRLLTLMQDDGRAYLSNAQIRGAFVLRACVVNFRTTAADMEILPELAVQLGGKIEEAMKSE